MIKMINLGPLTLKSVGVFILELDLVDRDVAQEGLVLMLWIDVISLLEEDDVILGDEVAAINGKSSFFKLFLMKS